MSDFRFLSVCSGIDAASVAWNSLGWRAAAFSEIEKFPSHVLAHHYPDTPNLGDMTRYHDWKKDPDIARRLYGIRLLVGGTPCQSFSVAGLRGGLRDPRGNLTLGFLGLVKTLGPEWVVWENVPGILSDKGNAFGQFLSGLAKLRYRYAYRVLDAQYFGVPQRRRRVIVVARAGTSGVHPAAVLFEPKSLCRDLTPSREAGEGTSLNPSLSAQSQCSHRADTEAFIPVASSSQYPAEICGCLQERDSKGADSDTKPGHLIPVAFSSKDSGSDAAADLSPTLRSMSHDTSHANGGGQVAVAFAENSRAELRLCGGKGDLAGALSSGGGKPGQGVPIVAHTLKGEGFDASEDGTGRGTPLVPVTESEESRSYRVTGNSGAWDCGDKVDTLDTYSDPSNHRITSNLRVRRLTPRECERLQGFPDDYTRLPGWNGWRPLCPKTDDPEFLKSLGFEIRESKNGLRVNDPDGPRYKALGNSMAVPVMAWIGQRIQKISEV